MGLIQTAQGGTWRDPFNSKGNIIIPDGQVTGPPPQPANDGSGSGGASGGSTGGSNIAGPSQSQPNTNAMTAAGGSGGGSTQGDAFGYQLGSSLPEPKESEAEVKSPTAATKTVKEARKT